MRPRWRSLGRRRPTTHRLRPKQRGGRRRNGFLVSRNGGARVPVRVAARGGGRQGKKIETRRCGLGGRGVSRPSGRSGHSRGRLERFRDGLEPETWRPRPASTPPCVPTTIPTRPCHGMTRAPPTHVTACSGNVIVPRIERARGPAMQSSSPTSETGRRSHTT